MSAPRPSLSALAYDIQRAAYRIRKLVKRTPLISCRALSQATGARVHAKLENLQPTGSFKVRGAANKILSLSTEQRNGGVITASTGNHGAAFAYALDRVGGKGRVYVPENASPLKLQNIGIYDVEVCAVGHDGVEAEVAAREYAVQNGLPYLSPYNDVEVIAGQGTIGLELVTQCSALDAVFVALGGGGLTAGVSTALRSLAPSVEVIACSPSQSKVMMASVAAGKIVDLPSLATLSDGTAGGIEADSITFDYCRDLVDEYVEVSEEEIAHALRLFLDSEHLLIEGAAAVPLAALIKEQARWRGARVALIICGGNISRETLKVVI